MQPLDKTLRSQLERAVKAARDTAETGARAALDQLGVADPTPAAHLSETERELRRRLRAHGRQLGDSLNGGKVQSMDRLVEEVAYEHWHRMLFARFLAENDLLMYPDPDEPVAITLEECEDLAADEGAANGWELAARYAARMLPQIFRLDSPVFQLTLPPEHQQALERQVAGLPLEVFTASDSLGWVYQFWQAKKKEQVNQSEVKIGARELPAVTQLFTEPYMVSFLLDNSLGAWWAARQLSESDLKHAESEEELRQKASIPGVPLDYLRFVKQEDGAWTPAAGTFDAWPEQLANLKTLDPCCGSGHFLVAAFLMLVPMRMERDGLSARDAVDAVLRENIHGLELDQRCVELAAFALALTAWKYPGAEGYRPLPELHLACTGLSVSVAKEEWKQLGLGKHNLTIALDWMHDTFRDAPVLGSLLNPAKADAAKLVKWEELSTTLKQALENEQQGLYQDPQAGGGEAQHEAAVVAQGLAKAATLLADQYQWVITNVPYLARGKQSDRLRDFCERHYPAAKNDLATVFLDRCLELCVEGGTSSIVLPQNWLFLTSYKKFREKLLKNDTWHLIARLGPQAFQTPMWDFNVQLISISRGNDAQESGGLFGDVEHTNLIRGVDVSEPRTAAEKAEQLLVTEVKSVDQAKQLENPDAQFTLEPITSSDFLSSSASALSGCSAGDAPRFNRYYWEVESLGSGTWRFLQGTVSLGRLYGGLEEITFWENERGEMYRLAQSVKHLNHAAQNWLRGKPNWGKPGVVVSQMRDLPPTLYSGEIYDCNACAVVPDDPKHVTALWAFCESGDHGKAVRVVDQSLKVTPHNLLKVPFDLDHWTKVAEEKYPNGLPKPYTDDPTQWIFHGHPCGSVVWDEEQKWTAHGPLRTDNTVLQVAIARLLGYRWPAELDTDMELADEQREWVKRCEALLPFADEDGIVCIPPVRGEASAADRLLNLLAAAYGDAWSTDVLAELLKSADHAGKTLETWLRDKFFTQHCKLFQHRPFIWHIWDGLPDGFSALVNYHQLDRKNLETLIYTYLGDWIGRQKQDKNNGIDGTEERLAAAESLKKKLEQILEGEAPYDIFVRWKPIEQQPIGWDPDLNDGVRLNVRPFMTVGDVKKKGAGVLRDKPNVKWTKDRGKDVESAPWYQTFKGERINDHHLTLAEKRAAREKV
ncbi:Eco57I restriction-modification methylase domain-containing protein [Salinicola peritrichatus]|uniref:Eco57I restriction-modification methylase domain-containing protein n=1 Tax=Salinicola peritrichatus TaxID=1267424 RepID=UPI000DA19CCE|nr:N-6 DNA methylase [Salinicola peritrichatus]